MVQQTLEATKSFIFDVRPMVLDDLGLVPTLRRAARERGRKAGVAVDFDSMGQDRRLPMDLESGLFRILDEALAGYLERPGRRGSRCGSTGRRPARGARCTASRDSDEDAKPAAEPAAAVEAPPADGPPAGPRGDDGGPAGRRPRRGRDRASAMSIVALPVTTWREIQSRAATLGLAGRPVARTAPSSTSSPRHRSPTER